jgi:PST family polysaccharide transporter
MNSFFPQLSQLFESDITLFRDMTRRVCYLSLFYSAFLAAVTYVLSVIVIPLFFGSRFDGAIPLLRVLVLALVPWSIAKVYGQILIAAGSQRRDLYSTVLVTVLNVALNLTLIPVYGARGAAYAFLSSMVLFAMLQYGFARKGVYQVLAVKAVPEVSR